MGKNRDSALSVVGRMPPKYHTLPGQDFDVMKSEVCDFLIRMPEVRQHIFDLMKMAMVYDPATRKWRGKYYKQEKERKHAD